MLEANYNPSDTGEGRRYGIEAEFFVVNPYTLRPVILDVGNLDGYGQYIKPELGSDQIEVSTPPYASLIELKDAMKYYVKILANFAQSKNAALFPVPMLEGEHPITASKRYEIILEHLGESARNYAPTVASDQINIGSDSEKEAFVIYNRMCNLLPVFTGFSVASPFRSGRLGKNASERMTNYNLTLAECPDMTGFPPVMGNLKEYAHALETQPIFQHPNSLYKYARPMPQRGVAVEIRSMDKQPTLKETMALAALAKGIVNAQIPEIEHPEKGFYNAVRYGIYDHELFASVLTTAAEHLDEGETEMLSPLFERMKNGTISDIFRTRYYRGESVEHILGSILVKGDVV